MKRFNKRGTAVPFFTPMIAILIMLIISIGMLIYSIVTSPEESTEAPQETTEYVEVA